VAAGEIRQVRVVEGYQIASWSTFFAVAAGVAATLTGLIFVAVSINLSRILDHPGIADRAYESILQMFGPLVVSMLALMPGQSRLLLGLELAATGLLLWIMQIRLQYRSLDLDRQRPVSSIVFSQLGILPLVAGGISLSIGRFGGLYWLAAGIIASVLIGVTNAWVLLVEILC
jgi:hypothetical protein